MKPFFPFSFSVNRCGGCCGTCNTIDDRYARACVPNKVKNMNAKVFNLMSGVNETRFLVQHEPCDSKYRLNESACNSKQEWNHNSCACECKELDDWGSCKYDYMWNPGMCDSNCNEACKFCEKRLIGKLVLECECEILNTTETLLNDKKVACPKSNCLIYNISLVIICLLLLVDICLSCFIYYEKYRPKQKHLLSINDTG